MATIRLPYVALEFSLQEWLTNNSGSVSAALFVNDYSPASTTTLADFTEATYPGYARQVLTINAPFSSPPAEPAAVGPIPFAFPGPSDATPVDVYGVYLVSAVLGSDSLLAAWRLDGAPQVIVDPTDYVAAVITLTAAEAGAVPSSFGLFFTQAPQPFWAGTYWSQFPFEVLVVALNPDGSINTDYNGDVTLGMIGGTESIGYTDGTTPPVLPLVAGVGSADSFAMVYSSGSAIHDDTVTVTDGIAMSACRVTVSDYS